MGIKNFWSFVEDVLNENKIHSNDANATQLKYDIICIDGNMYTYNNRRDYENGNENVNNILHNVSTENDEIMNCDDPTIDQSIYHGIMNRIIEDVKKFSKNQNECHLIITFDGQPPVTKFYTQHLRRKNDNMINSMTPYTTFALHLEIFLRNNIFGVNCQSDPWL
ncbi:hypothetical protein PV328_012336, partial [Microctonus aethiopoides]